MSMSSVQTPRTQAWADTYRDRWRWDTVGWASHCIDCYPGNCPMRVYVRDGKALREEQCGVMPGIEQGVPDMNPMGCQKGMAWATMHYSQERVLYPMRRDGERGSGKWTRISWDEALAEIADAVIDAIIEKGPESIIHLSGCNTPTGGIVGRGRFAGLIGALTMDLNAEMNDFAPGNYMTYGVFDPVSSIDDWFHSELVFIWFSNPSYTRIPHQHYIREARYNGAEVVTVAPDSNASSINADYFIPVAPGTDAALALAMSQVVIEEKLYNEAFIKEQTDLPLLVRLDTRTYLRGNEVEDGGRDDQFYWHDSTTGAIAAAPRGELSLGEIDPSLEGTFKATLKDGSTVDVTTVFELTKQRLNAEYTPEQASEMCTVAPSAIRMLARKVASKRTMILGSLGNASKYYHGDLIERSEILLLGLTGNWGRKGTGVRAWLGAILDGYFITPGKGALGPEAARNALGMMNTMLQAMRNIDPTMTDELASIEMVKRATELTHPSMVPPIFLWYNHAGYDKIWNRNEWHDPSMKRPFQEYWDEAVSKGWWNGVVHPTAEHEPRVFIEMGGNAIRRTRGGQNMLLQHLWPKLKMVAVIDVRMSTTAMFADIVLPAAQQYEKISFGIPSTHTLNLTFSDRTLKPAGEAKGEWAIFRDLVAKIEERAKARGVTDYRDVKGAVHKFEGMYNTMTANGGLHDEETLTDEMVRDSATAGTLPEGSSLATLREKGFIRFTALGSSPRARGQAGDVKSDETFVPLTHHTEKKMPYPTLVRRAQFYIDHPWFLEAGEELPCHKDPPPSGGNYPLKVTSGHNRWSIHSNNIVNKMMQQTNRGTPHAEINPDDAAARGIKNGQKINVFNDMGRMVIEAKLSTSVRPGQVIIYNGWEPYQFEKWWDINNLEPGMFKWLHLAGGYGHLKYWPTEWQPCPVMRATRVDIAPADGSPPIGLDGNL